MPAQTAPGSEPLNSQLLSPRLLDRVNGWYGAHLIATVPPATPDGDQTTGLARLLAEWDEARVVLFPDVWPGDLDGFFRLRLLQVLADRPPLPALSVIVLSSGMASQPLAGRFADRFRAGWPFARCVFLTEGDDHVPLSSLLGVPVGSLADPEPEPALIESRAPASQKIALHVQRTWGRCGKTIQLENQVEDLVRAGFLTIRLFTNGQWRRGVTLRSRQNALLRENSVNAGAHVNVVAVPVGLPLRVEVEDPDATWRNRLAGMASCRIHDDTITQAAGQAECVIANDLECVGPAVTLSPRARLMLAMPEDRAIALHHWAMLAGRGEAVAMKSATAAARVQAQLLGIPDICTFVSAAEMARLGPHCRRAVAALPRVYTITPYINASAEQPSADAQPVPPQIETETVAPRVGTEAVRRLIDTQSAVLQLDTLPSDGVVPRFDLLLVGSDHGLNVISLRWFLDRVWRPYLEARSVSVAIVGRVGDRVYNAEYASPLLHFLGLIEDLEAVRAWCRLTVVPDAGGAGLSMKMLTTLASGHPVATTSVGLRGLDPTVTAILPAHNAADTLAADILRLIDSPDRLEERRRQVRRAAEATRGVTDHATLIMTAPQPTAPGVRKRLTQWSRIAGDAPTPDAPAPDAPTRDAQSTDCGSYTFTFETSFPMSGSPWDSHVLLDGWHEPEPWGRWTDGADATLRVTLAAPTGEPLALELGLVPSAVGANLRIGVDGTMFPSIDPVYGPNVWDIPAELSAGKSSFVVSLHAGETVCPAYAGGSPDDRILGIGVSAVRLLSRQPTLCELNTLMPTIAGAMPSRVLLSGWHGPEDWGCWTSRTTASLSLVMNEPLENPIRLELYLALPPANETQTLALTVNGVALPAVNPAVGRNSWDLPLQATNARTELNLLLTVPETFSAARAGLSADDRELGVGLRGLRIVPTVSEFYEPGTILPLAAPTALEAILLSGWHTPENWGCWTSQHDAVLRLRFRQTLSGPFRLQMDLTAPPVATVLTLSVNEHTLPKIVPVSGGNDWSLPESLTDGQLTLLIRLQVADLFNPAEIANSQDKRILGVGVRRIALHREAAAFCPIGTLVRISRELGDHGMLWTGWHELERWGCWTSGPDATMRLRFDAPLGGACALEFDLSPPLLDPSVTLSVNDTVLAALHVIDGPNEWVVPPSCAEGQTELIVHLLVARPVRPMDVKDLKDDRILGVGLRSVRVRPLRSD